MEVGVFGGVLGFWIHGRERSGGSQLDGHYSKQGSKGDMQPRYFSQMRSGCFDDSKLNQIACHIN